MKRVVKYIVVPFRMAKGRFFPGEKRKAESESRAVVLAEALARRFAGVAAFEVNIDEETGEMHDPRELIVLGRVPDLSLAFA